MTSKTTKTAHSAVKSIYADMILAECCPKDIQNAHVLDIGSKLPRVEGVDGMTISLEGDIVAALQGFSDQSFDAIALTDQLYRIQNPLVFFQEALRLLKPGGRLVMLEPAISLASWIYYKYCSGCDLDMAIDPFAPRLDASFQNGSRQNIAYPTVLFTRQEHRIQFMEHFPAFQLLKRKWVGMIADPLSLGQLPYSLIPAAAVPVTFKVEDALNPFLGRWLSNKMLISLKKHE